MAMLHAVGEQQQQDPFVYTCNNCDDLGARFSLREIRYHCRVCDDFDLCAGCFQRYGHAHEMDKLGLNAAGGRGPRPRPSADVASPSDQQHQQQKPINRKKAQRFSIQRCNQSLVHACQCRDEANCPLPSCHKMKGVVAHAKACTTKINGDCPMCKQLIALCCYHAKYCGEPACPVLFCTNIKVKLRQAEARRQRSQFIRRRMQSVMQDHLAQEQGADRSRTRPRPRPHAPPQ